MAKHEHVVFYISKWKPGVMSCYIGDGHPHFETPYETWTKKDLCSHILNEHIDENVSGRTRDVINGLLEIGSINEQDWK